MKDIVVGNGAAGAHVLPRFGDSLCIARCDRLVVWRRSQRCAVCRVTGQVFQKSLRGWQFRFGNPVDQMMQGVAAHPDLHQIWIRTNLDASPHLEFVVAHETRHAWQKLCIPEVFNDEYGAEADAYPYAYAVLITYLEARGELTAVVREDINNMRTKREAQVRAECPGARFEIIRKRNDSA